MKQLIVLTAVFILLMAIILQIPLEMLNYERKEAIEYIVNNAKEMAKQEGYYSEENLNDLREKIARKMGVNIDEIIIGVVTTRYPDIKYRPNVYDRFSEYDNRSIIYLRVSIPFKKLIVPFFGQNDTRYYVIEKIATSERLENR